MQQKTNIHAHSYIFHEIIVVKSQHAYSENVYTVFITHTFSDFRYDKH